jgi:hypothetical protein
MSISWHCCQSHKGASRIRPFLGWVSINLSRLRCSCRWRGLAASNHFSLTFLVAYSFLWAKLICYGFPFCSRRFSTRYLVD